jgi:hypothetical protein
MIYNTNYICQYQKEDLFLDNENLTDENKEMIRDDLYRNDFLNVFNLDEYDEEKLTFILDSLYESIVNCDTLKDYICKFSKGYDTSNFDQGKFGIIFLFSFEHLYLFHPCICDYLNYGYITEINLDKIKVVD